MALLAAAANAAQPLVHSDFEQDTSGWVASGSRSAHVHVMRDRVKTEHGVLVLDFEASRTEPGSMLLPVSQSLLDMKSMRFWLMADSQTAATVNLLEKQGRRYQAIVWSRKSGNK